ncbi:unnamed protein product [Plutella xylostella]|uniref:(diamondback moth) hypothetical protein n=1 Tax=Plutella xylostella TaxID=51655 RepID=A0A8S4EWT0_PLUXY|nr:unnamed protein product [Plutella xylostella]
MVQDVGETEGLSSGCEASGFKEEIARDYAALQSRLRREFSDRQGKLYSSRPVATEEQLSADFRKKLAAWQARRGARQPPPMPARQDLSDDFLKKWDEWKRMKEAGAAPAREDPRPDEVLVQTSTGLFKFQGESSLLHGELLRLHSQPTLLNVDATFRLVEPTLLQLHEPSMYRLTNPFRQLKIKIICISRHFTRKLHEWEKSRGIAPEASTSALLRAARAQPPALARAQSAGSVAAAGPLRRHASSLSVNDADDIDLLFDGDGQILAAVAFYGNGMYQKNVGAYYHLGLSQAMVSYSIQEICDANLKITYINSAFAGASHDSHVWNMSEVKAYLNGLQGENVWLLGDSGYGQSNVMMTPILNAAAGSPEEHYTNVQVRARNVIERCFGVLKGRWRCLLSHRTLHYAPAKAGKIVNACAILHNMCREDAIPYEAMGRDAPHRQVGGAVEAPAHNVLREALVQRLWASRHE